MRSLIYKYREEPTKLKILRFLNYRTELSKFEFQNYINLQKGYEGEKLFDIWLQKLDNDCLILNDLLFKTNNQLSQIDSLIIFNNAIYIFEIKNFTGDFYYKLARFFKKDGFEITNPLIQLQRSESLLRQLLLKINVSIPVHASVIFINPEFTLYQVPMDKPFIFPTQINRLMKKLANEKSILNEQHYLLADKLLSQHMNESPYQQLPNYDFKLLRKGITCATCHSNSLTFRGYSCICLKCEKQERIEAAVVRTVREFQLLFPNEKITALKMYEWCKINISKKTITRILGKNFTRIGVKRCTFYK